MRGDVNIIVKVVDGEVSLSGLSGAWLGEKDIIELIKTLQNALREIRRKRKSLND